MDIFGIDIRSGEEELKRDWLHAEEYFAFDILKGELDLCTYAAPPVFAALARVWLRDVVQLKAYNIWKDQKGRRFPSQVGDMQSDYQEALRWFYRRVSGVGKCTGTTSAFNTLRNYLVPRYLEESTRHIRKGGEMYNLLVKQKAHRCWELSGERDEGKNWAYAENFVKLFYNNIFSAIFDGSEDARQKVTEAVKMSEDTRYNRSIVNCFEGAVLIYFI